jgi:hypothetical protein
MSLNRLFMGWPVVALFAAGGLYALGLMPAFAQTRDPGAVVLPGEDERAFALRLSGQEEGEDSLGIRPSLPPTGGLPQPVEENEPGARFFTATQSEADTRRLLREEELRRLAIPDEALVTGSVDEVATPLPVRAATPDSFDPYAPLGIRAGPLTWFPSVDVAIGYDSNVDSSTNAREVRTVRLSPELRVESDWRRHAWTGSLRGSLSYVDDGRDLGRSLAIDNTLRLDLGLDTDVDLRAGYTLTGESVSDPDAVAGADGTTDTHLFTGGVTARHTLGPVEASLALDMSRALFSDTPLAGGGVQSNDDRNRSEGALTLRLQQAQGPVIRPFVEGTVGLRRFDEALDRNGFARDSVTYGLRGGVTFAEDRPLRGEVSLGVVGERFEDDALEDALALSAAAALTWDVSALTRLTLDVATTVDPTTQAGSGVGVSRSATLGVSHALRRNVELRLGAGVADTQYSGIDAQERTYTGTAGITWRASPVMALRFDTAFEHEPDATGDVNRFTAEAGVTFAR